MTQPLLEQLAEALKEAEDHLCWIGWGDRHERKCAFDDKLPEKIEAALKAHKESKTKDPS